MFFAMGIITHPKPKIYCFNEKRKGVLDFFVELVRRESVYPSSTQEILHVVE